MTDREQEPKPAPGDKRRAATAALLAKLDEVLTAAEEEAD